MCVPFLSDLELSEGSMSMSNVFKQMMPLHQPVAGIHSAAVSPPTNASHSLRPLLFRLMPLKCCDVFFSIVLALNLLQFVNSQKAKESKFSK